MLRNDGAHKYPEWKMYKCSWCFTLSIQQQISEGKMLAVLCHHSCIGVNLLIRVLRLKRQRLENNIACNTTGIPRLWCQFDVEDISFSCHLWNMDSFPPIAKNKLCCNFSESLQAFVIYKCIWSFPESSWYLVLLFWLI